MECSKDLGTFLPEEIGGKKLKIKEGRLKSDPDCSGIVTPAAKNARNLVAHAL